MARVYLETSFVSACVTSRTDAASVYRREASLAWMDTQARRHELVVSAEVLLELDRPEFSRREQAMAFIEPFALLGIDDRVIGLAGILVQERVMPGPAQGDAIHVAACCIHGVDYLLSWNVRHLANPNKLVHLQTICVRTSCVPPRIITPDLLWENE